MLHQCTDTDTCEQFEGMGFHISLCLTALYNKETGQYEIDKEQLWESFKAQMQNQEHITYKTLYCNSCDKTQSLPYGTIVPVCKKDK